jgi:hypothetical protein
LRVTGRGLPFDKLRVKSLRVGEEGKGRAVSVGKVEQEIRGYSMVDGRVSMVDASQGTGLSREQEVGIREAGDYRMQGLGVACYALRVGGIISFELESKKARVKREKEKGEVHPRLRDSRTRKQSENKLFHKAIYGYDVFEKTAFGTKNRLWIPAFAGMTIMKWAKMKD